MPTDLSYLQNFLISLLLLLFTNNDITTNKRVIGYFRQEFFIVFKLWFVGVVISAVVRPFAFNLLCVTLMLDIFFLVVNFKCCVHYINHLNSFFPHHSSNLFIFLFFRFSFIWRNFVIQTYLYLITFSGIWKLCVPDWPMYNRNPIKWLDSVPDRKGIKSTNNDSAGKKK